MKKESYKIFIDDSTREVHYKYFTGADLKRLVNCPMSYKIWATTGRGERDLGNDETVDITQPDWQVFYTGSRYTFSAGERKTIRDKITEIMRNGVVFTDNRLSSDFVIRPEAVDEILELCNTVDSSLTQHDNFVKDVLSGMAAASKFLNSYQKNELADVVRLAMVRLTLAYSEIDRLKKLINPK